MRDDNTMFLFFSGTVVGALAMLLIFAGILAGSPDYRTEAIKNGNAQYDTITGKWEWIPHKEPTP